MRALCVLLLVSLVLLPVSRLIAADKSTAAASHWTINHVIEACALAQAVDVQKDVGLTAKQAKALKPFVDDWRKRNHAFRKANRRPSPDAIQKHYGELTDAVDDIITLDQFKRLREICFQCDGVPSVVVNHEQSDTLFRITHEQRGKLVQIESGIARQRADAVTKRMANNKNPLEVFNGTRAAETEFLRDMNKQALAVLDPKQRDAWQKLIGKPFKGRLLDGQGKQVHARLESL